MKEAHHPHNVFQYCPKCGEESLAPLNEKAVHCTSCGFVFYINAASAVAGIIENEKGEILMTRRAQDPAIGTLDLPGGFVDHMESVEAALFREIKEELNIELKEMTFFGSFPNKYVYKNILYYTTDMIFLCKVESFDGIRADDDISAFEFVKPKMKLIDHIGLESIKKVVTEYVEYIKK